MRYAKFVLIALDQCVNALLGGWPDETLSSRAWRWHMAGVRSWPCKAIDVLFWWDYKENVVTRDENAVMTGFTIKKKHCQLSFESERNDRHQPPELRGKGGFHA